VRRIFTRFFAALGEYELGVLLAFLGIAGGVWLFAVIADQVSDGNTQSVDAKILLSFRHPADLSSIGTPAVQDAARDVTALGGVTILTLLTAITSGFLFFEGRKHMAGFVVASVLGGVLLSTVLKDYFQRPRPDLVPHGASVSSSSFPSGHSMLSAVTYLTLGALLARSQRRRSLRAYWMLLAGLITFAVGVSRVYLGVHWPTDVLAGWTAGATWALFCWLLARHLQGRRSIEDE
jgi:undecaprenyl-diphosphatase